MDRRGVSWDTSHGATDSMPNGTRVDTVFGAPVRSTRWPAPDEATRHEGHRLNRFTSEAAATMTSDESIDLRHREPTGPVPVLAVVGRPNVGKSTLVNRILGRREAVVEDVPGVTRDRVPYDAEWNGRRFTVVDTGGWDPDARGMAEQISLQAEIAVALADAVLFVVDAARRDHRRRRDGRQDPAPVGQAGRPGRQQGRRPARRGRRRGCCGTSVSGSRTPVSALHGRGSGDLLDAVLAALAGGAGRRVRRPARSAPDRDRREAQRRQVEPAEQARRRATGSSSTTSPARRWTRSTRSSSSVVGPGCSSTRPGSGAGSRRRADTSTTRRCARPRAMERAEVAVVVIDAGQPLTEQDQRIISARRGVRPRRGDRLQQVGHGRRGAPPLPRPRDRARPGARAVGAAGQHHGADRLARRPAGAGAGPGARRLGDAGADRASSTRSSAGWSRRIRTRCAAASSRGSCSRTQASVGAADVRAVHDRSARGRRTRGSSSGGCARSSASSARRSTSTSRRGRSASGPDLREVARLWRSDLALPMSVLELDREHFDEVLFADRLGRVQQLAPPASLLLERAAWRSDWVAAGPPGQSARCGPGGDSRGGAALHLHARVVAAGVAGPVDALAVVESGRAALGVRRHVVDVADPATALDALAVLVAGDHELAEGAVEAASPRVSVGERAVDRIGEEPAQPGVSVGGELAGVLAQPTVLGRPGGPGRR